VSGERRIQVGLLVAALASLVVMFGLFSAVVRVLLLVVMAGVVVITAPQRAERGGGWWMLLTIGVVGSIASAIIAQVAQTLGGVLAVIFGLLVVIAATIGLPVTFEEDADPEPKSEQ
jgi:hypothetical protein